MTHTPGDLKSTLLHLSLTRAKEPITLPDHSPTPWHHCTCGKCGHIWSLLQDFHVATAIDEMEDGAITQEQRQANAKFIVTAVNAHDKLVAALERIATDFIPDTADQYKLAIDEMRECAGDALALTKETPCT